MISLFYWSTRVSGFLERPVLMLIVLTLRREQNRSLRPSALTSPGLPAISKVSPWRSHSAEHSNSDIRLIWKLLSNLASGLGAAENRVGRARFSTFLLQGTRELSRYTRTRKEHSRHHRRHLGQQDIPLRLARPMPLSSWRIWRSSARLCTAVGVS